LSKRCLSKIFVSFSIFGKYEIYAKYITVYWIVLSDNTQPICIERCEEMTRWDNTLLTYCVCYRASKNDLLRTIMCVCLSVCTCVFLCLCHMRMRMFVCFVSMDSHSWREKAFYSVWTTKESTVRRVASAVRVVSDMPVMECKSEENKKFSFCSHIQLVGNANSMKKLFTLLSYIALILTSFLV
jgi:hypothetical protein